MINERCVWIIAASAIRDKYIYEVFSFTVSLPVNTSGNLTTSNILLNMSVTSSHDALQPAWSPSEKTWISLLGHQRVRSVLSGDERNQIPLVSTANTISLLFLRFAGSLSLLTGMGTRDTDASARSRVWHHSCLINGIAAFKSDSTIKVCVEFRS